VVSGPVSGADITLRAGQRLVVNLAKAETLITEDKPEKAVDEIVGAPASPVAPPPAVRPSVATDKPAGRNPAATPAPSTVASTQGERRWADELASGHWDRILEDVERAGIKATLDKASSEDLFALADAARYRRRTDLARAALLAERSRFPGSPRSLDAVFLLEWRLRRGGFGTKDDSHERSRRAGPGAAHRRRLSSALSERELW
jgi:hypothetical protein